MPPDVLNVLHMVDIPARELKYIYPKRADSHRGFVMRLVANTSRGIQGAAKQAAQERRALRASPCTSPLVQRIGMSKQLLLVIVSVDRVGQRGCGAAGLREQGFYRTFSLPSKPRGVRHRQGRHHQLCTAASSALVDCRTQQLPVAVVSSPDRRFVLQ
jgi:hypothetical protein